MLCETNEGYEDTPGGRPLALEVKSSVGPGFLISAAEWGRAETPRASDGDPARCAVLVVRRSATEVPGTMDLLVDPYDLAERGHITREPDTFAVSYTSDPAAG